MLHRHTSRLYTQYIAMIQLLYNRASRLDSFNQSALDLSFKLLPKTINTYLTAHLNLCSGSVSTTLYDRGGHNVPYMIFPFPKCNLDN